LELFYDLIYIQIKVDNVILKQEIQTRHIFMMLLSHVKTKKWIWKIFMLSSSDENMEE